MWTSLEKSWGELLDRADLGRLHDLLSISSLPPPWGIDALYVRFTSLWQSAPICRERHEPARLRDSTIYLAAYEGLEKRTFHQAEVW